MDVVALPRAVFCTATTLRDGDDGHCQVEYSCWLAEDHGDEWHWRPDLTWTDEN